MRIEKKTVISPSILSLCFALLLSSVAVKATPYASCITNNSGTITFYLNEGGGNVVITYEDGSTNANYNGITTGTNQASGAHTFSLTGHTSYAIAVTKTGAGVPSMITSVSRSSARGDDVNKNPASPYFGRLYSLQSAAGGGVWLQNSDLSNVKATVQTAGVAWVASSTPSGTSPYHVSVAPDDSVIVADFSNQGSAVWMLDPNCTTNQLVLGPVGTAAGNTAGVHGSEESRALITGSLATSDLKMMIIDGDYSGAPYNSILTYDIGSGPLPWQSAPSAIGYEVGLNITGSSLNNVFPGLTQGTNGYIYASEQRGNLAIPNLVVLDSSGSTLLWSSADQPGVHDWFVNAAPGGSACGLVDSAVSLDGKYLVGLHIDNHFTIVSLTNGIPDVSTLFVVKPTAFNANGRGICWDAADNLYMASSGLTALQTWTLGFTATAVTTGNDSGPTGFQLITPATTASVVATIPQASQGGSNGTVGTPVAGVYTITRTDANSDYSQPLTVNFSLSGTATNGVYTCIPTNIIAGSSSGTVVIPAGQTNVTISIVPSTANVPRLTTTVLLQIKGGSAYSAAAPISDTVSIQNTSSQQLNLVSGGVSSMYKPYPNDFSSFVVQRLGDLNAPSYSAAFSYAGTAVAGTDFTVPSAVTIDPGVVNITNTLSPLIGGLPPVHTNNPVYSGNKTVVVGMAVSADYTAGSATSTNTIIDDAKPAGTVLLADPLTDPNDSTNWNITYGNGDAANFGTDYEVDFGYDLTGGTPLSDGQSHPIPLPPSGATTALRVTCNKAQNPGVAGAVNVYYTNQVFAGDFAVRFSMNLIQGANPAVTTEGVIFGINHNGSESNWYYASGPIVGGPWASDGIWYYVTSDPGSGSAGDFVEFTGNGSVLTNTGWKILSTLPVNTFKNAFKVPQVFTTKEGSNGGVPANGSPFPNGTSDASTWSDVEIKQVKGVVTLSINKTPIFVYTNTTTFTNGYLMLGYTDPFGGTGGSSVGTVDAAAYFSDLKVVSLAGPSVIGVTRGLANVTIGFVTSDADDTTSSFALQAASVVTGPYADVTATITQLPNGNFQAVANSASAMQFYRIRHK